MPCQVTGVGKMVEEGNWRVMDDDNYTMCRNVLVRTRYIMMCQMKRKKQRELKEMMNVWIYFVKVECCSEGDVRNLMEVGICVTSLGRGR